MGSVVLVKKMSVHINFLLQNTNLVSILSKSAQILLVMSDRTDESRESAQILLVMSDRTDESREHFFRINELPQILKIIGQCDIRYIMMLC
jgi:hypothetical protein